MGIFEGILIGAIVILGIVMLRYYIHSKRGFAKFIVGVGSGVGGLIALAYILPQYFSLNVISICVSAVLGLPGVALLWGIGLL